MLITGARNLPKTRGLSVLAGTSVPPTEPMLD
jgi:hypothetical protein